MDLGGAQAHGHTGCRASRCRASDSAEGDMAVERQSGPARGDRSEEDDGTGLGAARSRRGRDRSLSREDGTVGWVAHLTDLS
jgi:hypothetical protein